MSTQEGAAPTRGRPTESAAARRLDAARVTASGDTGGQANRGTLADEQPFQLLPPLTAEEYATLRDSIVAPWTAQARRRGLLPPAPMRGRPTGERV